MSLHVSYYDEGWRTKELECACGWRGTSAAASSEPFDALCEYSCPACQTSLLLVSYPTGDEVRAAAARGNAEAQAQLETLARAELRRERHERTKLKSPDQLPDLVGTELHLIWDLQVGDDGDQVVQLKHGVQVIWTELAFFEDWPRFNEVKEVLKERYGERFASLRPSEGAKVHLFGDDSTAATRISYT
jgi:hypothetical protein